MGTLFLNPRHKGTLCFFSADTPSSSLARLILKMTNNTDNLNSTIEREAALGEPLALPCWGEFFDKIIYCLHSGWSLWVPSSLACSGILWRTRHILWGWEKAEKPLEKNPSLLFWVFIPLREGVWAPLWAPWHSSELLTRNICWDSLFLSRDEPSPPHLNPTGKFFCSIKHPFHACVLGEDHPSIKRTGSWDEKC